MSNEKQPLHTRQHTSAERPTSESVVDLTVERRRRMPPASPPPVSARVESRDVMARALAEHERLDVGWQCYLGAVDAVLIALKGAGFSVVKDSTVG